MTIYDTYAECKKNHPEKDVLTTGKKWDGNSRWVGKFLPNDGSRIIDEESWIFCNPADYLTSLEEFFDDGYKFVDGDVYINEDGFVDIVGDEYDIDYVNTRTEVDFTCFVLSAKALEESKTEKTNRQYKDVMKEIKVTEKFEYVEFKCKSFFELSEPFNLQELYFDANGDKDKKSKVLTELHLSQLFFRGAEIYRRIEIETPEQKKDK